MKMLTSIALIFTLFTFAKSVTIRPFSERTHDVEAFKKLKLEGVFQVTLKQGSKNQVIVKASEKLQSKLVIEENKGELYLHMKKQKRINQTGKIEITIVFTEMEVLQTAFVGSLESAGTLILNALDWENASVGNVDLDLKLGDFKFDNSSVGQITLSGSSNKAHITNAMVGDLDAEKYIVEYMNIENSSVGQCTIHARKELSIMHAGMGNFYYSGGATVISMSSPGIGKVKKQD